MLSKKRKVVSLAKRDIDSVDYLACRNLLHYENGDNEGQMSVVVFAFLFKLTYSSRKPQNNN